MAPRAQQQQVTDQLQSLQANVAAADGMEEDVRTGLLSELAGLADTLDAAVPPPGRSTDPAQAASEEGDVPHRLSQLLDYGPESYLVTDARGMIRDGNASAAQLLGVPLSFLPGKPLLLYLARQDHRSLLAALHYLSMGQQRQLIDVRLRPRGGGDLLPASLLVLAVEHTGKETEYWWVLRDETERRLHQDDLVTRANHDGLTGLMNRSHFLSRLRALVRTPGLRTGGVAVLFLDLDRFKVVNDRLGHAAGDELLRQVADRLIAQLREGDFACRLGGDEFVVALGSKTGRGSALALADRIRIALSDPFVLTAGAVPSSCTIGVTVSDGKDDQAEDLVRDADQAMYVGKAHGRNRVRFFDTQMRYESSRRKQLVTALERSLRAGRLQVHYQPEFDLTSGRIIAVEALVRWETEKGLLPADEFIAVAEDSGLIEDIGRFVIARACQDLGTWRRADLGTSVTLAVNLSPTELNHPDTEQTLRDAIEQAGIRHADVCIEVTEREAMEHLQVVDGPLERLRGAGAQVAIDDFGVGHSSLARLRELTVDAVKIDRSFVARIPDSREDRLIVGTVCELADMLGLSVIAEGVETPEQLATLRTLGCRLGQGDLLAPASPAATVAEMLVDGWRLDLESLGHKVRPLRRTRSGRGETTRSH